jgi:hypothetical protein
MFERGEIFLRGGSEAPTSFLTPLSSQKSPLFTYKGSGWRGARGEVNSTRQMQTEPMDKYV